MEAWEEAFNFSLIHDAKLPKYFDSARWKRGYNPDVAFVSTRIASTCQIGVLDPIPRTQHRPITTRSPVTAAHCPFRRRFFFFFFFFFFFRAAQRFPPHRRTSGGVYSGRWCPRQLHIPVRTGGVFLLPLAQTPDGRDRLLLVSPPKDTGKAG